MSSRYATNVRCGRRHKTDTPSQTMAAIRRLFRCDVRQKQQHHEEGKKYLIHSFAPPQIISQALYPKPHWSSSTSRGTLTEMAIGILLVRLSRWENPGFPGFERHRIFAEFRARSCGWTTVSSAQWRRDLPRTSLNRLRQASLPALAGQATPEQV